MDTQIVRNWMTPNPITTTPETTRLEARRLIEQYYIRRLPVIERGILVGIVTLGDLREAQASCVTALSVSDLHHVMDRLTAEEFMANEPIAVAPDATIEQAARLMLRHKIGGLPVVENGELVGMITETDFCRLLIWQPEPAEEI